MTLKQKNKLLGLILCRQREARKRFCTHRIALESLEKKVVGDWLDQAAKNGALGREFAMEEHDRRQCLSLEEAKQRLDTGDFGRCRICQRPIRLSRLLAVPETTFCYDCAVMQETRCVAPQNLGE